MKKRFNQRFTVAIAVGMLVCAGTGLLFHTRSSRLEGGQTLRFGTGLEQASYDLLFVARGDRAVTNAVLVYLDEKSHQQLGQPLNAPWDRALHARLVDRLTRAGAKAIAFDIVFSDSNPDKAGADAQFVESVRESGRVVLAADNVPDGPHTKRTIPPFDALADVAASLGSAETEPSSDLIIRLHTPRGDNPLSALSWATAEFLECESVLKTNAELVERWVNYYGRPGLLPGCSYFEALDPSLIPDDFFRGRAVFVGARIITKYAGDRKDEYPSPFTVWLGNQGFMSGVEIQATMFLNLERGDWISRAPNAIEQGLLVLFGILIGGSLVCLRPIWAALGALLIVATVAVISYALFVRELVWFPWAVIVVQCGAGALWSILFNSIQLYVQKRLAEQSLAKYLSPKLVKKFAVDPKLLQPGASKQMLTFFFSDIASFTSISEGMDSDELAHMMNRYFETAVSRCIHKTDGTVVKYIGDAIFAFWNAPEPQANHALRACEAALLFREAGTHSMNGRELITRIGLHTGIANVGNFGSVERVDYTALGESVNLASRLEGLNKYLGTVTLISGDTRAGFKDELVTRCAGRFRLKGFEKAVEVHELIGWGKDAQETQPWRDAFAAGLEAFCRGDLSAAKAVFERTLELHPGDGPAEFYLARIKESGSATLPSKWNGEIELKEK